jgi:hypothetical protein
MLVVAYYSQAASAKCWPYAAQIVWRRLVGRSGLVRSLDFQHRTAFTFTAASLKHRVIASDRSSWRRLKRSVSIHVAL